MESYKPDLYLDNLKLHMDTLEHRHEKLLTKLNVCQSVCEFYSFGYPPDYILYIGEALGEAC